MQLCKIHALHIFSKIRCSETDSNLNRDQSSAVRES